jgi:hypothetical protein
MPRYFLQLRDHTEETLDPEGSELETVDALKAYLLTVVRDLISADVKNGVIDLRFRVDAEDVDGAIIHTLPFGQSVNIITEEA